MHTILIIGSGPDASKALRWPLDRFDACVAINNAWQATEKWTHLIYPYDFPATRMPSELRPNQRLVDEAAFVPAQNHYGGFVYAGGTMAFTAAYWALFALRPKKIAFIGCDMIYPATGQTHFYGTGQPDPLRKDISLTSLEACSARFYCHAHMQDCQVWNLSQGQSRLIYPRNTLPEIFSPATKQPKPNLEKIQVCLKKETELGYFVEDGRYWHKADQFDPEELQALDEAWMMAVPFLQ